MCHDEANVDCFHAQCHVGSLHAGRSSCYRRAVLKSDMMARKAQMSGFQ